MESHWTWRPAASNVRTALGCTAILSILFVAVYGGCNWLTSQRSDVLRLYFDWELSIPLIPWMVWVYLSLCALFILPMFCLGREALLLLAKRLAAAILASGVIFLLLPAQLGFSRAASTGGMFAVIHTLDLPHNLVPSLHVVMSGLILGALSGVSPLWARYLFAVWFIGISMSVVLVHQHHLLDVLAALPVTCVVIRTVRHKTQGRTR